MSEKVIIKIINRSSKGATLLLNGNRVIIPWDEFNHLYEVSDDRLTCWLTDEAQRRMDELDEILTNIATTIIMSEHCSSPTHKASLIMTLPGLHRKVVELAGCSDAEAFSIERLRLRDVKSALAGNFKPSAALKTSKPKPQPLNLNHGECLADNEVLKRLKEEME